MKALVIDAKWDPRPDYQLTEFELRTGKAITGSSVWRYPKLQVAELEEPRIGPDDVLIRVKATGVCGSDMHFYETDKDGYILYPGLTKFPVALGHEFSGQVVEVGKNVRTLKPGDMVTAEEMIWCGECEACRRCLPNQCENLEEIGFTIHGTFAEYIALKAKYCWKINALLERYGGDEDKVYEAAATIEPHSVSYNAIFECAGGFRPGAYAVVYGAGTIGLAAIGLLKAAGAAKIIAFEVSEGRRKLAEKVGAHYVYDPRQVKPHEVIMDLTEGKGAEVHVECAGAPAKTVPEVERSIAIGGWMVMIGRAAERVPMYLEVLQTKKAKVVGAQGHSGYGNFPNVIRMIAAGLLDPTVIITARYSLDDVIEAIRSSGDRQHGKIMVRIF